MKTYDGGHPWKLLGYKAFYFSILHVIYRMPIPYQKKQDLKKVLFYDNFTKYAKTRFKIHEASDDTGAICVYDMGPFRLCIYSDSDFFTIDSLEWNLSYEFLDIIYPALNPRYFNFMLGEGPYEVEDVRCEKGDYVLDAGANIGAFSFLTSNEVGDKGRVFAVEPIDFFIKCMKRSIKMNSASNVSILEYALGKDDREIELTLDPDNPMNTGVHNSSSRTYKITQKKLDTLVFDKKIPRVDFIKMDIEGFERHALKGGSETIFKFKPKLAICTYHLKDDPVVIRDLIKSINPAYKFRQGRKKLYAWI